MLLVLGDVAGDRLVAELGELDPKLPGRDDVAAVPDHRPVAARQHVALGHAGDHRAQRDHSPHRVRQRAEGSQDLARAGRLDAELCGQRDREQVAGGHLGVEGLRGRDAHLDVAAVGRVQHAVGLVDEVAVPAVDDGDDGRASGS